MGSFFRRLAIAGFWIGLCAAVVGAVVLERRQIQRHDATVAAQAPATVDVQSKPVEIAEHANAAGRSRATRLPTAKSEVEGFSVQKNISYGADPLQKLDLYSPNEPLLARKALVFVHGGSLNKGDKDEYRYVGEALALRGYSVIVANYRLAPAAQFPVFIEDTAKAVRWSADRFGAEKLFLMGHSAGGYIVSMLAANNHYLADAGVDRARLAGVIAIAGTYDFLPMTDPEALMAFGNAKADPAIEPKTFLKMPLPPLLLIHGAGDTTVPPQQSERLASAWGRAGGQAELKLYTHVAHMQVVESLADTMPVRAPTRDDVLTFMENH